jgi:hypothetical protein
VAIVRPKQRAAVAVLLNDFASTVHRIEIDRQVNLAKTPRVTYRIFLDLIAKREGRGFLDEPTAVREAFADLVPLAER